MKRDYDELGEGAQTTIQAAIEDMALSQVGMDARHENLWRVFAVAEALALEVEGTKQAIRDTSRVEYGRLSMGDLVMVHEDNDILD